MRRSLGMLIYAAVLGVVCASLLTGAAMFTEPYRIRNAQAEKMRHVLGVLEVPYDSSASPRELAKVFEANIRREDRGGLPSYVYAPPGAEPGVGAVAVGFEGPGLWGPIKGVLALDAKRETIREIT